LEGEQVKLVLFADLLAAAGGRAGGQPPTLQGISSILLSLKREANPGLEGEQVKLY
jgi:hypothetical protein